MIFKPFGNVFQPCSPGSARNFVRQHQNVQVLEVFTIHLNFIPMKTTQPATSNGMDVKNTFLSEMKRYHQRFFRFCISLAGLILVLCQAHGQVPWLHVEGNQIKDPGRRPVTLRGYSLLPAEHNAECHYCNTKPIKTVIDMATDQAQGWYPNTLRIGVTMTKSQDPAVIFSQWLDPYVQHAIAKGVYVIVDLHFVADYDGNNTGNGVPQSRVLNFWNYVAPRYANTPNVIFEVFNEPINPDNWTTWKNYIQPVVNAIRALAPDNLIFMGSPQWSTRVNGAVTNPIAGSNIVYVYHIYPNQGPATAANLDARFGNASQTIPIVISEFGWNKDRAVSDGVTNGTTSGWGIPFRNYLDARPNISWQSYIFDNFWKPQYFDRNWNLLGGENQGQFMKQWLFEMKDQNSPLSAPLSPTLATPSLFKTSTADVAGAKQPVQVYPNPASNTLNIEGLTGRAKGIIVTDMMGNKLMTVTPGNKTDVELDIRQLKRGLYVLKIVDLNNKNRSFTFRKD